MGCVTRYLVAFLIALATPALVRAQDVRPIQIQHRRIDPSTLPNLKSSQTFSPRDMHVIQLSGPMTREMRIQLEAAGVRLADYLPENAYLADLAAAKRGALGSLPFVRWVGRFDAGWKK